MEWRCAVRYCKKPGKHAMPRLETLRKQWEEAINSHGLKGWRLLKSSKICSAHFKKSDFCVTVPRFEGDISTRLRKCSIPSIFPWNQRKDDSDTQEQAENIETPKKSDTDTVYDKNIKFDPRRSSRTYSRPVPQRTFDPVQDPLQIKEDPLKIDIKHETDNKTLIDIEIDLNTNHTYGVAAIKDFKECKQTDYKRLCDVAVGPTITFHDAAVQTCDLPSFSSQSYIKNNEAIKYYTGLESYEKVKLVFDSLGESVDNLQYFYGRLCGITNPFEQFFMTLIILHCHKSPQEMAIMYSITWKHVSNIFITWVRFMSLQWRKLDIWPDKSTVRAYTPSTFFESYPNVRAVMGFMECPIKTPGKDLVKKITCSEESYTVKFLIGTSPSGLITYVSPCYGGAATDQQIFDRSDILQRFEYGDEIMMGDNSEVADNVYNGVYILKSSETEVLQNVIGLMQAYRILSGPFNRTEMYLSSDIVFVCAMLVNFRSLDKTSAKKQVGNKQLS